MDDTVKALHRAAERRSPSANARRSASDAPVAAPERPAAVPGVSSSAPSAQISMFAEASPAPAPTPAADAGAKRPPEASIDPQTIALMEAYERGAWTLSGPHRPAPLETKRTGDAPPNTGKSANLTEGHRARLRTRFQNGEQLADYELLELLLFRALPRRDTKPIAKALIKRFGSFARAVSAPSDQLQEIDGLGPAAVTDFRLVRAAAERFAFDELEKRPVLSSTDAAMKYYRTRLRTAEREEFHVLFVDKKHNFLASECLGVGTVDHTPVYPRELMRRALALSASAVILVHNHPSGDPTPSRADVAMTQKIVEAAATIGVNVLDHLIVAADDYTSLKGEGLM